MELFLQSPGSLKTPISLSKTNSDLTVADLYDKVPEVFPQLVDSVDHWKSRLVFFFEDNPIPANSTKPLASFNITPMTLCLCVLQTPLSSQQLLHPPLKKL
eukprot:m.224030 g.224030  ORF g.224030 m.224030 type:complete len:101 (+) comp26356_c1_seq4:2797-3099(+)